MSRKISEAKVSFEYIYEEYMRLIVEKTKLKREYLYGVLGFAFVAFTIGRLEIITTYIITCLFPIIWSLEDYQKKDEDLVKMWGSYWGIYGFFVLLDLLHKLFIAYIPLYFFLRTIILLWMYLPCFKGAIIFYNVVFVELFKLSDIFRSRHNEKDSMLAELQAKLMNEKKTN